LPIKKHWLSPNVHFKSRKVNFIAWQFSKLGRSEPAPTRAPCLGWISCGIDNSLVYTSVALFLVFRRTVRFSSKFGKNEIPLGLSFNTTFFKEKQNHENLALVLVTRLFQWFMVLLP
jgi:hypothetical protein